jgi:hypothetical protein
MISFMTVRRDGGISLITTLEDPETGWAGDVREDLNPGEGIGQYTYAELRAHGSGEIDIDFDAQPVQPAERLAA